MSKKVLIKDVCNVVTGSTPKSNVPEYWNGNIKWITPAEISEDSFIVNDTVRHITEEGVRSTGLKSFPKGTVILSSRAPIGKVAIAGCEMYCNQGFKNIICGIQIYNEYLYWFLKSKSEYLNSLGRGATFKEISKNIVDNIEVPLPNFEVQIHLADTFNKIKDLENLYRGQLVLLDQLVKSRFIEMFGNPKDNPKRFKSIRIGELTDVLTGSTPNRSNKDYYEGKIPWVKTGEIHPGYINSTEECISEVALKETTCKLLPVDTVMIAMYGQGKTRGQSGILGIKAATNQACAAILPCEKLNPVFLNQYLVIEYSRLRDMGRGAQQANLNLSMIKNYHILSIPIELQNQFADFVAQVNKSKFTNYRSLLLLIIKKIWYNNYM